MTFEQTRQILESRMFETAVNPSLHPYSTRSEEGTNRLASITSLGEIVAVQPDPTGIFEEVTNAKAIVYRDGHPNTASTTIATGTSVPFVVMFINDSASRVTAFNKALTKSSGSVRFTIYVPRDIADLNPVKTTRLIADAIDLRMGFQGGSTIPETTMYPMKQVGGTLFTQSGSLNRLRDEDNGFMVSTLDFIYDYYN